MLRRWLFHIAVWYLQRDLIAPVRELLTKQQEDGILAQLWVNPAFRRRIAERDAKLIHAMAGGEGMQPEPRDKYHQHAGQRVENLLLARDAKAAWTRIDKARKALASEQEESRSAASE